MYQMYKYLILNNNNKMNLSRRTRKCNRDHTMSCIQNDLSIDTLIKINIFFIYLKLGQYICNPMNRIEIIYNLKE
jgi:predicted transcriptional regulator